MSHNIFAKASALKEGFLRRIRWKSSKERRDSTISGDVGVLDRYPWAAKSTDGETLSGGRRIDTRVCNEYMSYAWAVYGT